MSSGQAHTLQTSIPSVFGTGFGIDCVFLTCFDSRFQFFAELLRYGDIRMHSAETLDQADFILTVTGATTLLSDVVFLDGTWHDALEMLAHVHPLVVMAVIADSEDRESLAEASMFGAFAVLWRPFGLCELRHLIKTANEAVQQRSVESALSCESADHPLLKYDRISSGRHSGGC